MAAPLRAPPRRRAALATPPPFTPRRAPPLRPTSVIPSRPVSSLHCVCCGGPLGPDACSACGRATARGLREGTWVLDRYQLRLELPADGAGSRWVCVDADGQGATALVLSPEAFDDSARCARFLAVLRPYQGQPMQHVEPLRDIGPLADGTPVVTWGLHAGPTLATIVDERGPMLPLDATRAVEHVARALGAIHARGLVHGDLRPEQVVWSSDGLRPAEAWLQGTGSMAALATTAPEGMVVGAPKHMAPERFTGSLPTSRSDLYEMALLAFELFDGRHPFEATTPWEWATCHLTRAPRPWTESNNRTPPRMRAALCRCLQKKPEERFASIEDFLAAAREPTDDDIFGPVPPRTSGVGPYRSN